MFLVFVMEVQCVSMGKKSFQTEQYRESLLQSISINSLNVCSLSLKPEKKLESNLRVLGSKTFRTSFKSSPLYLRILCNGTFENHQFGD